MPIPQTQEQIVESIRESPREIFPVCTEEQIVVIFGPPIVKEIAGVVQIIPQERSQQRSVVQLVGAPVPQVVEIAPPPAATSAATSASALMTEYVTPTPTDFYAAPARVIEYVAPALGVSFSAPAPVIEDVTPAPAVTYLCNTSSSDRARGACSCFSSTSHEHHHQ